MDYLPCPDIDYKTQTFVLYTHSTYVKEVFAPYFTFT